MELKQEDILKEQAYLRQTLKEKAVEHSSTDWTDLESYIVFTQTVCVADNLCNTM